MDAPISYDATFANSKNYFLPLDVLPGLITPFLKGSDKDFWDIITSLVSFPCFVFLILCTPCWTVVLLFRKPSFLFVIWRFSSFWWAHHKEERKYFKQRYKVYATEILYSDDSKSFCVESWCFWTTGFTSSRLYFSSFFGRSFTFLWFFSWRFRFFSRYFETLLIFFLSRNTSYLLIASEIKDRRISVMEIFNKCYYFAYKVSLQAVHLWKRIDKSF